MERSLFAVVAFLSFSASAYADDPPPVPRTHVDTTVVGDSAADNASMTGGPTNLDNDHRFVAGAPEIVSVTKQLHLSPQQDAQVNSAIEKADAGAASLIKREHNVRDMIAATTPQDPLYATLISEQASADTRWTENRESLRREVVSVLTPVQRTRFEELQPKP